MIFLLAFPVFPVIFCLLFKVTRNSTTSLHSRVAHRIGASKPISDHMVNLGALLKLSHLVQDVVKFKVGSKAGLGGKPLVFVCNYLVVSKSGVSFVVFQGINPKYQQ